VTSASPRENRRRFPTRWIESDADAPQTEFADAVRIGLDRRSKFLPSQFFYDDEGSRLFEEICELPEYYLTRAETEILESHATRLAAHLPIIETLVELGSGSAIKTERLLHAFEEDGRALRYVPIDVSASALEASVARLEEGHPNLEILPVLAEYEAGLEAIQQLDLGPMLTIWLGSSIGNLDRESAGTFLARHSETMADEDRLLIGIDLRKEPQVLERAYDDSQGITARFDMNLLARINRELNGRFDLSRFRHRVRYDEASGSVQSFLESQCDQRVRIDDLDLEVRLVDGERIHTEDSLKYSPEEIDALAASAGLRLDHRALDEQGRFSLNLFQSHASR
jgi:dimethylhistidine N-methyltransferase